MCEDKNRTANKHTKLREIVKEFQIFGQLPGENQADKILLNFAVSANMFIGVFLNFLLLPLFFINHYCLSYSAPIATL